MTTRMTAAQFVTLPRVILPWPVGPLWPNRSKGKHFATITGPRHAQRELAGWLATHEALTKPTYSEGDA